MHPAERGYTISPGDLFSAPNGTPLVPFPLNRDLPLDQFRSFNWRDTAVQERGAPTGAGADPEQLFAATGQAAPPVPFFGPGQVATIGLPLLMEFRCHPDDRALGLNAFDVSLATSTSSRPSGVGLS